MKATRAMGFSAAALVGFVIGWRLAGRHVARHRAALFSPSRVKRMAALSYLAGRGGPETIPLLADYAAWEPSAILRSRARRLMQALRRTWGEPRGGR